VDAEWPPAVRESLSVLPLRRQRLVINYFTSGNLTQSVFDSGYHPKTRDTAYAMGQDVMSHPDVQRAFAALTESSFSLTKLREIHAAHLGRYPSIDASDRDRSLRALSLAYKYLGARPGGALPGTDPAEELFAAMTENELEQFATNRVIPARLRHRFPNVRARDDGTDASGDVERSADAECGDPRWSTRRTPGPPRAPDAVNSHAARHAGQEPRESMEPIDPADVAPSRSAPPSAGAASCAHRDFIGAPAPVCGHDRVYDPTSTPSTTPAGPVNAHLAADAELERQQIAEADEMLRALRRQAADPLLRDLAMRDRRW
jgi:hypothetical protein